MPNLDSQAPEPGELLRQSIVSEDNQLRLADSEWQEVEAPANTLLVEGTHKERKLKPGELKQLQREIAILTEALAYYDYRMYPRRVDDVQHAIQGAIEAKDRVKLKALRAQLAELEANPPSHPADNLTLWRRLGRFIRRQPVPLRRISKQREIVAARAELEALQQRLREHEIATENETLYADLEREMLTEVGVIGKHIINRWAALEYDEVTFVKDKRVRKTPEFEEAHYTIDEIQYKIRVSSRTMWGQPVQHLPRGVSAWDLVKPETLRELQAACQYPVASPHTSDRDNLNFENGAWVIVYRHGLIDGLFNIVPYDVVLKKYNQAYRANFAVPVGVKAGRIVEYMFLDEALHGLYAGKTGAGKSNLMRCHLITWLRFFVPEEIRFYLVDLKRGGDFVDFEGLPHLAGEIIYELEHLAEIMPSLTALMNERMLLLKSNRVKDLAQFNRMVKPERMLPRVVIMIDECADISNSIPGQIYGKAIWSHISEIIRKGRAVGIHIMLGTQQAYKDVIPSHVRDNLGFRWVGYQPSQYASINLLGDKRAADLPRIKGRGWADNNGELVLVQTPLVNDDDIKEAVKVAAGYGTYEPLGLPSPEDYAIEGEIIPKQYDIYDIASIAIEQGGALSQHKIHGAIKDDPESPTREKIKQLINEIVQMGGIVLDTIEYKVSPYKSGFRLDIAEDTTILSDDVSHDGIVDGIVPVLISKNGVHEA